MAKKWKRKSAKTAKSEMTYDAAAVQGLLKDFPELGKIKLGER